MVEFIDIEDVRSYGRSEWFAGWVHGALFGLCVGALIAWEMVT